MKDNQLIEVYKADVTKGDHSCVIVVKKYWADLRHSKVAVWFIESNSTFRRYIGQIDTFKKSLRVSGNCQVHLPDGENICNFIERKIRDAYGKDCEIKVVSN